MYETGYDYEAIVREFTARGGAVPEGGLLEADDVPVLGGGRHRQKGSGSSVGW
jgi:hypothetical protein